MKLSKFKEDVDYFTSNLSSLNRQYALAGIAIIWVFKRTQGDVYVIPNVLLYAAIFIAISLVLDLIQYFYQAICWTIFYRIHEKKNLKSESPVTDPEVLAPVILNMPSKICFYLKIVLLLIAYYLIVTYLLSSIACF